jgi:hypothetical protein
MWFALALLEEMEGDARAAYDRAHREKAGEGGPLAEAHRTMAEMGPQNLLR